MKIDIDLKISDEHADLSIRKNMEAMEWAVNNCPARYLAPMVDNKHILKLLFSQYFNKEIDQ
jgi:hypothetical protein